MGVSGMGRAYLERDIFDLSLNLGLGREEGHGASTKLANLVLDLVCDFHDGGLGGQQLGRVQGGVGWCLRPATVVSRSCKRRGGTKDG